LGGNKLEISKAEKLEIGNRIRGERKKRQLTQERLAEAVGVSTKHLGNIENGKSNPSFKLMEKIAEFMNIPLDAFLDPITEKTKSNMKK